MQGLHGGRLSLLTTWVLLASEALRGGQGPFTASDTPTPRRRSDGENRCNVTVMFGPLLTSGVEHVLFIISPDTIFYPFFYCSCFSYCFQHTLCKCRPLSFCYICPKCFPSLASAVSLCFHPFAIEQVPTFMKTNLSASL